MPKKKEKKQDDSQEQAEGGVSSNYSNVIPNKKKILEQYRAEKLAAIRVRQVKINNWVVNEQLYNGINTKTLLTRANLHVPKVFEGVHTMSSKLGEAPTFSYHAEPEGDENAPDLMKHVVQQDLDDSQWSLCYEDSKIECGIYCRAIYEVIPGNDKQKVELVDTMAFLISPIARNTKNALYQGRQFIYKTQPQLNEESIEMGYDTEEMNSLKTQKIANETQQDTTSEASLKNLRLANMGLSNVNQYGSKVVEITKWYTYITKKGKPVLHELLVANDTYLLRCIESSKLGLKRPPFISWGVYTRGITFWCPSVADIYRDPNLAINVSLNQTVDNNTYRNFGMIFVSSNSGLKQSSLVPRPLGITPVQVSGDGDKIQDKVMQFTPPEVSSGLTMMNTINSFADNASGLTASNPGQGKGGKQTVTQQAAASAAVEMKTSIMKKQSTLACEELYQLMADLTASIMTKPRTVKIFGYQNLTVIGVTYKNFNGVKLYAKASPAENSQENKQSKQKAKMALYEAFKDDPKVPGQLALRRSLVKSYDIDAQEAQGWFTQEEQPQQQQQNGAVPDATSNAPEQPMTPEQQANSETQLLTKPNQQKP